MMIGEELMSKRALCHHALHEEVEMLGTSAAYSGPRRG